MAEMKRVRTMRQTSNGTKPGALRDAERILGRPVTLEEATRVLKAKEAARYLGVDESTIRHMSSRGELAKIKTGSRGVGYRLLDLIEWQEAHRVAARI
jgi:excisionase family DNA binding protein